MKDRHRELLEELDRREWRWAIWVIRFFYWRFLAREHIRRTGARVHLAHGITFWILLFISGVTIRDGIGVVLALWAGALAIVVTGWSVARLT